MNFFKKFLNEKGIALPFVAVAGALTMAGITFILQNTTQEKNVKFAQRDVAAETIITGYFVYADSLLKQRKCIDFSTGSTDEDCEAEEDWTNDGYTPRLLLTESTAAAIASSVGGSASSIMKNKIEFTMTESSLGIDHPLSVLMRTENRFRASKINVSMERKPDSQGIIGYFFIELGVSLLDSKNKVLVSGKQEVFYAPLMVNNYSLVLNRNLNIGTGTKAAIRQGKSADGDELSLEYGRILNQLDGTGGEGIVFESPVFVNGSVYIPHVENAQGPNIVFNSKVDIGGSLLTYKDGSSSTYFAPERGGVLLSEYNGYSGFLGGVNRIKKESALDGFFAPKTDPDIPFFNVDNSGLCPEYEERKNNCKDLNQSKLVFRKTSSNEIEMGLTKLNEFKDLPRGSSPNNYSDVTSGSYDPTASKTATMRLNFVSRIQEIKNPGEANGGNLLETDWYLPTTPIDPDLDESKVYTIKYCEGGIGNVAGLIKGEKDKGKSGGTCTGNDEDEEAECTTTETITKTWAEGAPGICRDILGNDTGDTTEGDCNGVLTNTWTPETAGVCTYTNIGKKNECEDNDGTWTKNNEDEDEEPEPVDGCLNVATQTVEKPDPGYFINDLSKRIFIRHGETVTISLNKLFRLTQNRVTQIDDQYDASDPDKGVNSDGDPFAEGPTMTRPTGELTISFDEIEVGPNNEEVGPNFNSRHKYKMNVEVDITDPASSLGDHWEWLVKNRDAANVLFEIVVTPIDFTFRDSGSPAEAPAGNVCSGKGPVVQPLTERTISIEVADANDANPRIVINDDDISPVNKLPNNDLWHYINADGAPSNSANAALGTDELNSLTNDLKAENFETLCGGADPDEDFKITTVGNDFRDNAFSSWNFNPISKLHQYNPQNFDADAYEALYDPDTDEGRVGNKIIIDDHNHNIFHIFSILDLCVIKEGADHVLGFLVCRRLQIEDRGNKLDMIGTFVVDQLELHPNVVPAGLRWYNIFHPGARKILEDNMILRGDCDSDPENPYWKVSGSDSGDQYKKIQDCRPSDIMKKADPFKWTSFTPECGPTEDGSLTLCNPQGIYRKFISVQLNEEVDVPEQEKEEETDEEKK